MPPNIIYSENSNIFAKYNHPKCEDYVQYNTILEISDKGKEPVSVSLKFVGIRPCVAPQPPDTHSLKAEDLMALNRKLIKWLKKYGYYMH